MFVHITVARMHDAALTAATFYTLETWRRFGREWQRVVLFAFAATLGMFGPIAARGCIGIVSIAIAPPANTIITVAIMIEAPITIAVTMPIIVARPIMGATIAIEQMRPMLR